ncbi:MAG: hypothetical protein KDK76_03550 [Chlamydiia bacterium]|nr:hypothetical protein [Chlamydiia bacterium]
MKKELILLLFICPLVFFYVFSNNMSSRGKTETVKALTFQHPFEELEGKNTGDWSYIQTERDYKDIDFYKSIYKKNQHHQFNSSPIFKIPKTIHLIWIGPRPFPRKSVENIRTWMAHHPDWTFIFWTDRKQPAPCRGMVTKYVSDFDFQFLQEKFEESKNWGEKSDLWRYEILYQYGGIYIDHDAKCLRPFHNLNTGYDFYACLEMPHEGIEDLAITAGIGVIGARANHPVLKGAIQTVLDRWDDMTMKFSTNDPVVRARRVAHRSYIAMTHAFKDNLNSPENTDIVFPACYFYPKSGLPGFYSEHLYGTTWHSNHETDDERDFSKKLRDLRHRDAKTVRVEVFCLFALIGCFFLYYLINRELRTQP